GLWLAALAIAGSTYPLEAQETQLRDRVRERTTIRDAGRGDASRDQTTTTKHAKGGKVQDYIVACTKLSNKNEVELARLAEQKAENQEVKAFASKMIKDHTAFLEKL